MTKQSNGKADLQRRPILSVVLILSVALNVYFIWAYRYNTPDRDFLPSRLQNAYFVKKHVGGEIYVIEHSGHRYTVKCQPTLTWLNGIYSPGAPMSDGCIYIPGLVGKSIAAGLMRKEGNALVFQPWEDSDTEQTADILTIISDEKQ